MRARIGSWLAVGLLGMPLVGNAQSSCSVTPPSNGTSGTCPSTLPSGDSCVFACDSGYSLNGAPITCNNGVLSGQETCTPSPCAVPAPADGTLGTCTSPLQSGTSCQFTCNSGYTLNGAATTCSYGQLTAQTCTPSSCSVYSPTFGNLGTCPSTLPSGSSCSFTCVAGYTLNGAATSCTDGTLTAQTCTPSSCAVPAPANGTLGTCTSPLQSGASCQFTCNSGYNLSGAATTCSYGQLTAQTCTPMAEPANQPSTDGPIPLWALGVLAASLAGVASRRIRKAK
jgi:hypothetical protein